MAVAGIEQSVVGHLYQKTAIGSREDYDYVRPIYIEQELLIGRDFKACNWHINNPTISARHLKIYSISYEAENNDIEPLVYATDLSRNGSAWNGVLIGKGQSVLLSDCDELVLGSSLCLIFRTKKICEEEQSLTRSSQKFIRLDRKQETDIETIQGSYFLTSRKLGVGGTGTVYMAINKHVRKQVACKIIKVDASAAANTVPDQNANTRRRLTNRRQQKLNSSAMLTKLLREVEILKGLCHPNVIGLEQVYRSKHYIYIFQELIAGGDLFSYIMYRGGKLHEAETGVILIQLLEALNYLHTRGIVHRDVKPENILVDSLREGARIILSDFGLAFANPNNLDTDKMKRMLSVVGTFEYRAP